MSPKVYIGITLFLGSLAIIYLSSTEFCPFIPMTATLADVAASVDAEGQAPELELAEEIQLTLWWKLEHGRIVQCKHLEAEQHPQGKHIPDFWGFIDEG
jgi:hypothetical protein